MRMIKKGIFTLFMGGMLLLSAGCIGAGHGEPANTSENEVAIAASFRQEDGTALYGSTVRFSFGERHMDHSLDDNGALRISGLPKAGELVLSVLDRQEQMQGGMTLSLAEGAVIDATTDAGGVGHITLRGDTDEVTLLFVLQSDGSLLCSLGLTQPDPLSLDLLQEVNSREG